MGCYWHSSLFTHVAKTLYASKQEIVAFAFFPVELTSIYFAVRNLSLVADKQQAMLEV